MMAGVAVVYERGNKNSAADGTKSFGVTGDFTWDFGGGATLFASGVWVNNDLQGSSSKNPWGATVQGGYFVNDDIELFARYEYIDFDVDNSDTSKYNGFTVGANYFFAAGVKFTADFTYNMKSLSGNSAQAALNGAGLRTDAPGKDGQWAIRAQLQLLF